MQIICEKENDNLCSECGLAAPRFHVLEFEEIVDNRKLNYLCDGCLKDFVGFAKFYLDTLEKQDGEIKTSDLDFTICNSMENPFTCKICGDSEYGPWGYVSGIMMCEPCEDRLRDGDLV